MEPQNGIILMIPPTSLATHLPNHPQPIFFSCEASLSSQILSHSLTRSSSILPRSSQLIFKTGDGIIQTENGIISPTSGPLIKKLLLLHLFQFNQGVQNWFSIRNWNYPNIRWNYFSTFMASDQKTVFSTSSPYILWNSKLIFKTGNGII